jgi:hypothetical protein
MRYQLFQLPNLNDCSHALYTPKMQDSAHSDQQSDLARQRRRRLCEAAHTGDITGENRTAHKKENGQTDALQGNSGSNVFPPGIGWHDLLRDDLESDVRTL